MKDKLKTILEMMDVKGGTSVLLFALLKMDDLADRWSIIYSDASTSLGEDKRKVAFDLLLGKLKEVLSAEELNLIARVAVYSNDEHLVKLLLQYQTGAEIHNSQVNGNFVHEGYIIKGKQNSDESQKPAISKNGSETQKGQ